MPSKKPKAWSAWVLRYIASDEQEALMDAINSVGGSPPYGEVSYEEAEVVYHLLEDYCGPGMAKRQTYKAVRKLIRNDPYRLNVIDLFEIYDQITSNDKTYTLDMVDKGTDLCERVDHEGVRALFMEFRSLLFYRQGQLSDAMKYNMDALLRFLTLAEKDPIYGKRAAQCSQNAISFLAMSGDRDGALALRRKLDPILDGFDFNEDDYE